MWSTLHIYFKNDYYPSRNLYDPTRWEEDEQYILNALPDSLFTRHSIIRQDYRATVNASCEGATFCLLPYNGDYECVELDPQAWKMRFSGYGQKIFPGVYFITDSQSGRMGVREYLFDMMKLLGCSEAYIGFDQHSDHHVICSARPPKYTIEDYKKGKAVPQLFRDTFDDCHARLEELRATFPEYEIESISLLGKSLLPVKRDEKLYILDIDSRELAYPEAINDYQMYKNKLYIALGDKIIECDSTCTPLKKYNLTEWNQSILWE